jgi:hypothetical protein
LALLLVLSNHLPASLLSPELCLLTSAGSALKDTVDGGLALSLAGAVMELSDVGWGK